MKLVIDKEKCVGCRICELACSFYNKSFFCPDNSQIRVFFTNSGDLEIDILQECSCFGEKEPLCVEFCPTKAIDFCPSK